ncbi:MAG TPA: hypothetical protein VFE16_07660 [Candidatus Cybelea sp.]|nr:hypothetical protein [Candidatus Cybelea sp.]
MDVVELAIQKGQLFNRGRDVSGWVDVLLSGSSFSALEYAWGNVDPDTPVTESDESDCVIADSAAGIEEERTFGWCQHLQNTIEKTIVKPVLSNIVSIDSFPKVVNAGIAVRVG